MTQNYGSTDTTTAHVDARCSTADKKQVVSEFRRALPQFCVVGVKNIILLGWGLILGYPTILIPGLQGKSNDNSTAQPDFELSDEQISWIGSTNMLFVPIGCLISGLFMEALGKRRMMQLLNVPMLVAWALFYHATNITQIYIALGLSGMSGGLLEAPLLVYIAETVEPKYRGMLTASGTATVYGGVCLSFVIGSMLHWKNVAALSAIIPFCAFIAVFFVPETPWWLVAKNRVDDAHKSLQWLRGWVSHRDRNVETEFKDIISSVEDLKAQKKTHHTVQDGRVSHKIVQSTSNKLKPFTKQNFIAPFALVFISFIFSHFSGLTPLQTYSIQILHSYQVPINEYYATILLGALQLIGCLIGMAFVRSCGKRRLVFASFIGCGICFCAVATQGYLSNDAFKFDLKPNATSLNEPVDSLEKSILNTIVSLRNRYGIERDTGNFVNQINSKVPMVDENTFNANNYTHIDSEILTETHRLLQEVRYISSFSNDTHPKNSQASNGNRMNLSVIDSSANSIRFTGNNYNSSSNSTVCGDVHVEKLFELLNITKNIIVTFMPNVLSTNDDTNLTVARVNEIEKDMWNVLVSNVTVMETHLVEKVNELSITLLNVAKKIRLGSLAETDTTYRWIPLILLLVGSMFAHCGSKLFPWMLIGEVYPMEVRSTAAGMSSAVGYLVSFLSNKLFLTMVAALTLNGTFYLFSTVCLIAVTVLYFTLPETENRTLLEIQMFFEKKPKPNTTKSNDTNSTIC